MTHNLVFSRAQSARTECVLWWHDVQWSFQLFVNINFLLNFLLLPYKQEIWILLIQQTKVEELWLEKWTKKFEEIFDIIKSSTFCMCTPFQVIHQVFINKSLGIHSPYKVHMIPVSVIYLVDREWPKPKLPASNQEPTNKKVIG